MQVNKIALILVCTLAVCAACTKKNTPPPTKDTQLPYADISGAFKFDGFSKSSIYNSSVSPYGKSDSVSLNGIVIQFELLSDTVLRLVSTDSAMLLDATFKLDPKKEDNKYTFSNYVFNGGWGASYDINTGKRAYWSASSTGYSTGYSSNSLYLEQR